MADIYYSDSMGQKNQLVTFELVEFDAAHKFN